MKNLIILQPNQILIRTCQLAMGIDLLVNLIISKADNQ